jgi:hypothetical protein
VLPQTELLGEKAVVGAAPQEEIPVGNRPAAKEEVGPQVA